MSTTVNLSGACGHCGNYHSGRTCPRVKRITYHQNGTIASVEYFDPTERDTQGYPLAAVPLKETGQ